MESGRARHRLVRRARAAQTCTAVASRACSRPARRALGAPARLGAAPSRFAALAAASRARARRPEIAPEAAAALAAYLAPLPVVLLAARPETAALPEALERFGIRTLGELAKLPRAALADRFGAAGPLARDLARGRDTPLVPARAAERLEEGSSCPSRPPGSQLERALGLLIDRAARPPRAARAHAARRRALRRAGGGRDLAHARAPSARRWPTRGGCGSSLAPRLAELPAPADVLRLRAEGFGPPAGDQRSLLAEPAGVRAARLREAVRQARAVAGPDAALRILAVDPDSRVPERRLALAPWDP